MFAFVFLFLYLHRPPSTTVFSEPRENVDHTLAHQSSHFAQTLCKVRDDEGFETLCREVLRRCHFKLAVGIKGSSRQVLGAYAVRPPLCTSGLHPPSAVTAHRIAASWQAAPCRPVDKLSLSGFSGTGLQGKTGE